MARKIDTGCRYPVVAALVDNMLKELTFPIYTPHTIKFLDCTHPDGRRTYSRSLSFVLQKAAVDMFPGLHLFLDYTLPNGLYGELRRPVGGDAFVTEPAGADKVGGEDQDAQQRGSGSLPQERAQ